MQITLETTIENVRQELDQRFKNEYEPLAYMGVLTERIADNKQSLDQAEKAVINLDASIPMSGPAEMTAWSVEKTQQQQLIDALQQRLEQDSGELEKLENGARSARLEIYNDLAQYLNLFKRDRMKIQYDEEKKIEDQLRKFKKERPLSYMAFRLKSDFDGVRRGFIYGS